MNRDRAGLSSGSDAFLPTNTAGGGGLQRTITWKDAFWVASGVPALVLFSIGGIAATVGTPSWLCWLIAVCVDLH